MARAEFQAVRKEFAAVVALADFTLEVTDGELVTVLGPSGCGKSTLLRLTAGLEPLTSGNIRLDGRHIESLPPQQRDVAMVFQSYALYPHMTARGNIEFPLRMRGLRADARRRRVDEVCALLELEDLLDRRPAQLSGGQRQRVALARALVRHPAVFLLDEPLSNLDARLRGSVRQYIREVQRRLQVTTLYVTHDQTEAMTLGDRIVVMNQGRIQQVDTPVAIYERPANTFVAGFVGSPPMNLLPAECAEGFIRVGEQQIRFGTQVWKALGQRQRSVIVGIRPEAFTAEPVEGIVASTIRESREVLGSETLVRCAVGPHRITARLLGICKEPPARLVAPAAALHLFAADTGQRVGEMA
jgi:ABC-type sugar transport system ATPase subunit